MIKITDAILISPYSWNDLYKLKDWNTIRLCNPHWNSVEMTVITGSQIFVEVTVIENTWELLRESYPDWQEVIKLPNWAALKTI